MLTDVARRRWRWPRVGREFGHFAGGAPQGRRRHRFCRRARCFSSADAARRKDCARLNGHLLESYGILAAPLKLDDPIRSRADFPGRREAGRSPIACRRMAEIVCQAGQWTLSRPISRTRRRRYELGFYAIQWQAPRRGWGARFSASAVVHRPRASESFRPVCGAPSLGKIHAGLMDGFRQAHEAGNFR